jgi:hypothetical protein
MKTGASLWEAPESDRLGAMLRTKAYAAALALPDVGTAAIVFRICDAIW